MDSSTPFGNEPFRIPIEDVLDLHSVHPRDVKEVVDAWLDEVYSAGFQSVRIIHGRGIGVQREIVRSVLAKKKYIQTVQDAPPEAGGWGATIVTIR